MKRQIDNPSPGAVTGGKLVPSSHKRSELRHTIIYHRFREVIPVPDSLGEDAILIDIFTSRGYLKGQGVLISAVPSLGNKVICRYPGFTFQTFV